MSRRGFAAFETAILLAAGFVLVLIWLPFARAGRIASSEERALIFLENLYPKLSALKEGEPGDLRSLVEKNEHSQEVVFHTENLLERNGYFFRLAPISGETQDKALYAWPLEYGETGNAAFFVAPPRPILETRNHRKQYSGLRRPPAENAAPPATAPAEKSSFGKDAQEWIPVVKSESTEDQ